MTLDGEEAAIRANIDFVERQLNYVTDVSSLLRNDCKQEVSQLIQLKKTDQHIQRQFHELHSHTAAILKQRQRRYERTRAISERIESVERKKEQLHMEKEKVNYSIYSRIYYEQLDLSERRSNLSLLREKHKLIDQSNKEQILAVKRQLYLDCKRRQAEIMKKAMEKHDANGEEKRKKHLEVVYQEKVTILAKEIAKKKKLELLQDRILKEKADKEKAAEETARRIERLSKYNEEQRGALIKQRQQEEVVVGKYRSTFLPNTALPPVPKRTAKMSQLLEEHTAKGRKGSTNFEIGRGSSLDAGSKPDNSVFKSQFDSKDSGSDRTKQQMQEFHPTNNLLMTSIDIPVNRNSGSKISRPVSGSNLSVPRIPDGDSKPEMSTAKHTPAATRDISATHIDDTDTKLPILPSLQSQDIKIGDSATKERKSRSQESDGLKVASNTDQPSLQQLNGSDPVSLGSGPVARVEMPRNLVDPEQTLPTSPAANRIFNIEARDTAADLEAIQNERIRHMETTQVTYEDDDTSRSRPPRRLAPVREDHHTSFSAGLNSARGEPLAAPEESPSKPIHNNVEIEFRQREESKDSEANKGSPTLQQASLDSGDSAQVPKPINFVSFGGSKVPSPRGQAQRLDLTQQAANKQFEISLQEEF